MSKGVSYEDLMAVLRRHAELPPKYCNPNFLAEVESLLNIYSDIEEEVVNKLINDVWSF